MKLDIQLFGGRGASSSSINGKGDNDIFKWGGYGDYNRKQMEYSGSDFSDRNNPENWVYGTNTWSGKRYTNDEFVAHLEDSNFHTGVRMMTESGLTNAQVKYIKDNTILGQWGVGKYKNHDWWNKNDVQKIIDDAKKNVKRRK